MDPGKRRESPVGPNKAVSKWHCQVRVFSMICGVRSDLDILHAVSEARDPDTRWLHNRQLEWESALSAGSSPLRSVLALASSFLKCTYLLATGTEKKTELRSQRPCDACKPGKWLKMAGKGNLRAKIAMTERTQHGGLSQSGILMPTSKNRTGSPAGAQSQSAKISKVLHPQSSFIKLHPPGASNRY